MMGSLRSRQAGFSSSSRVVEAHDCPNIHRHDLERWWTVSKLRSPLTFMHNAVFRGVMSLRPPKNDKC